MKRVKILIKVATKVGGFLAIASLLFFLYLELFNPIKLDKLYNQSRIILAQDNQWLFVTLNKNQKWRFGVDSAKLDPLYLKMLLNFEDKNFYNHFGVDILALFRASWQLLKNGHITSGGSTITMQLARLLEPKKRSFPNKIFEIFRALELEMHYSKKEILDAYLTLAPYGGNIEGVVAASMHYFGKQPTALTPQEAALLVALPQSPNKNRPTKDPKAAKEARNKVLKRALKAGIISQKIYKKAKGAKVINKSFVFRRLAPHLSLRLLKENDDVKIYTTIHLPLQIALQQWAKREAKILPKEATIAATVIRNKDSAIVAYLGSYDIFNRDNAGFIDMLRALRSPGSVLKPFIYALAIQKHLIDTNTIINDRELQINNYRPHNFTQEFYGEVTIAKALQNSLNIPAIKVLDAIGVNSFVTLLETGAGKVVIPNAKATLPIALGGFGIKPIQVAQLYVLLANNGRGYKVRVLKSAKREQIEILTQKAAQKVTNILRQNQPPRGYINSNFKLAYKTGTSYGYRDFWSVAYSKEYTILVWIGKANNKPLFRAAARDVAAPLAFNLYQIVQNILPHQSWEFAPQTTTSLSPPPLLQYFDKKPIATKKDFDFIYPKENSRFQSASCQDVAIEVAIKGGVEPFVWYVDNKTLLQKGANSILHLSQGAHTITVIDNLGNLISRNLWVDAPDCSN